jgi:hypothetical protein
VIQYLPAAALKPDFRVLGHFYTLQFSPLQTVACRSVLELIHVSQSTENHNQISQQTPNAVVIMMNPGSSEPLVPVHNICAAATINELAVSLVPTKPDTTQYQILRLMHYFQWQHVRVINLSDLRCAKSPEFISKFTALEAQTGGRVHSIFAPERRHELAQKLVQPNMPILCGWGVSDALTPLIEQCLTGIHKYKNRLGVLLEGTSDKYRHPLPMLQKAKEAWFQDMVQVIENALN